MAKESAALLASLAMLKTLLKPFASLKLTVVLLALSILLIYVATGAQTEVSVQAMQHDYFYSAFVLAPVRFFMPLYDGRANLEQWLDLHHLPSRILLPGGYLLGVLLLINLLAAHITRFKVSWKRSGILLIHFALILLLVGEGISSALKVESYMVIEDGQTVNYSVDPQKVELAIISPLPGSDTLVTAISGKKLGHMASAKDASGRILHDDRLPFDVRVDAFYSNSDILGPMQAAAKNITSRANAGAGAQLVITQAPPVAGMDSSDADVPSAYITPMLDGKPLGTYVVSTMKLIPSMPQIDRPQPIEINGRTYFLQLRPKRYYKSYTLKLTKFSFDRYLGTDVAKNYSSDVLLSDPSRDISDRKFRIWMNHPLRYDGDTLYQANFNHKTEKGTVLEVVSNPAAWLPYIALAIGGIGLLVHFGMMLVRFLMRTSQQASAAEALPLGEGVADRSPEWAITAFPWIVACCCIGYLITLLPAPKAAPGSFDAGAFGHLPMVYGGRVQPIDSVARNALNLMSGHEKFEMKAPDPKNPSKMETKPHLAVEWLLNLWANPTAANDMPVIRVDHPQLAILFTKDPSRHYFSKNEIFALKDELFPKIDAAERSESGHHDAYSRALKELGEKLKLYNEVSDLQQLCFLPPLGAGEEWHSLASEMKTGQPPSTEFRQFVGILDAFNQNQPAKFNDDVAGYRATIAAAMPGTLRKTDFEYGFNRIDPLMQAIVGYIAALLMVCLSWLFWRKAFWRAAITLLLFAFALHTIGLISRIYISGRPPVTNLPSSAIFIAWAVVLVCLIIEYLIPKGICLFAACMLGMMSLFLANRLSAMVGVGGDTLGVLTAVLDTNVWLATHVVCITLGYAGTLLAGLLGMIYVLRGLLTRAQPKSEAKVLSRMIYGVVCFALLFSFVGTILGGIWADQSWGRFWGWDPKENGAALIVLANALLLHARWAGWAKARGVALLAVANNIVVGWSWFGTNMLGVGLHSYGFLDAGLVWLEGFVAFHLAIIAFGLIPLEFWRSHRADLAAEQAARVPPPLPGSLHSSPGSTIIPVPGARTVATDPTHRVNFGK